MAARRTASSASWSRRLRVPSDSRAHSRQAARRKSASWWSASPATRLGAVSWQKAAFRRTFGSGSASRRCWVDGAVAAWGPGTSWVRRPDRGGRVDRDRPRAWRAVPPVRSVLGEQGPQLSVGVRDDGVDHLVRQSAPGQRVPGHVGLLAQEPDQDVGRRCGISRDRSDRLAVTAISVHIGPPCSPTAFAGPQIVRSACARSTPVIMLRRASGAGEWFSGAGPGTGQSGAAQGPDVRGGPGRSGFRTVRLPSTVLRRRPSKPGGAAGRISPAGIRRGGSITRPPGRRAPQNRSRTAVA